MDGDLKLVCVYNAPLARQEKHRPDGSAAPAEKQEPSQEE
jgi:hypothetical protein